MKIIQKIFKKQIIFLGIAIISLTALVVTISYAIFSQVNTNTQNQKFLTGSLEVTFQKDYFLDIGFSPKSTFSIMSEDCLASSYCYPFTVENIGSLPAEYKVMIRNNPNPTNPPDLSNYLSHDNIYVSFDGKAPVLISDLLKEDDSVMDPNEIIYIVKNDGYVDAYKTKSHQIRIWLKSDAGDETIGKKINIIVDVESIVSQKDLLKTKIIADNGGKPVINGRSAPTFSKAAISEDVYNELPASASNPNLSKSNTVFNENEMYSISDDYTSVTGESSYYYRGAVLNNNLIFAGFQWKIIRINGNGTIRMIYNGSCPDNIYCINNFNTTGPGVGTNYYSYGSNTIIDSKFVGYMYGPSGVGNSTSYIEATNNSTSNNIKDMLDSWYAINIISKGLDVTDMIADGTFCNDRNTAGLGYGSGSWNYGAYSRLNTNKNPSLLCENTKSLQENNDRFTVSDITIGNGALTYPVGLITADEMSLAGALYGTINNSYFLKSSARTWTMTPGSATGASGGGNMFISHETTGFVVTGGIGTNNTAMQVRPVINLKANTVVIRGNGTESYPYIIE